MANEGIKQKPTAIFSADLVAFMAQQGGAEEYIRVCAKGK